MSLNPNLKLDWCSFEAAKYAVINWHYSHTMPSGKLVKIGVWENGKYIGCVLFGRGANNVLGNPYGLKQTECCELVRIALTKHDTHVSRIMAISIRLLQKKCKNLKMIISFADSEQNHHGGIYQASNWLYAGMTKPAEEYIVKGKRMHGRSMRALYVTHVGKPFIKKIMGSSKHRYLYFLDKELKKSLKLKEVEKPKRAQKASHVVHS